VYGFIGRITGDKGVNELFTAAKKRLQETENTWLMLVGDLEKVDTLDQTLLQWAQNEKRVVFCGYTEVVEQYLSAMDVYILPSHREGFGSAVVEAEAMSVPVIVTDIPGPTDAMLPNETGIVIEKENVDALYEGMRLMQEDEAMRMQFARNAHRFALEKFEQTKLEAYILEDRKRLMNCL
jgi:glycosyltransferase involved in cell wall biosynthesis